VSTFPHTQFFDKMSILADTSDSVLLPATSAEAGPDTKNDTTSASIPSISIDDDASLAAASVSKIDTGDKTQDAPIPIIQNDSTVLPALSSQLDPKTEAAASLPTPPESHNSPNDTVAMSEKSLFADNLLSPSVASALPQGYVLRALRPSDFSSGFLDCLRVLTTVGEISQADFEKQFDRMASSESYYIIVIEDSSRPQGSNSVVATGALIVEHKLYVLPYPWPITPCRSFDTIY
jgi:hypothetical protein